jgi:hypothetical protein
MLLRAPLSLTLLGVPTLLLLHSVNGLQCYNINGQKQDSTACTPNPGSHCCATRDTCVGDTLCLSQFGTLYSEDCTDPTFNSAGCPKYCRDSLKGATNKTPSKKTLTEPEFGASDLMPCSYTNAWQFCCGLNCCKANNPTLFTIGNATNIYENRLSLSSSSSSSSTAPATASTSTSTSTSTCTSPSTPTANNSSNSVDNVRIQYGAGLGIGLGVPLLIALALLYFEHTKRIRAEERLTNVGSAPAYSPGMSMAYAHPRHETASNVAGVHRSELEGHQPPQELSVNAVKP